MTLLELYYQRRLAKIKAARLLNTAMSESRALTIPEDIQFDGIAARVQELDAAITERQSLRKTVEAWAS
jgi:hypothetical protein